MNIYGVKFSDRGKVYYFNAHDLEIKNGVYVIVETEKGLQYGKVLEKIDLVLNSKQLQQEMHINSLKLGNQNSTNLIYQLILELVGNLYGKDNK